MRFWRRYKHLAVVVTAMILALALQLAGQRHWANLLLGATALGSTVPLVLGMIADLRSGRYGVDILAATAIVSSVLLKEYWAGIVIVLMLTGGETLEDYAERRATTELSSLLKRRPRRAHLLKGSRRLEVAAARIKPGDKLVVLAGEVVPVDGQVLDGSSALDESSLTGESLPVDKQPGDQVLSGSVNGEGVLTIRATATAAASQYEQIIRLVRGAAASQAPFVRLTDKYSIPFTIVAFIAAGAAWAVSGQAIRFLAVLVVATPCPLLLAAPIALVSGMSRASRQGIIIKTGSALEKLAAVKTIAFDKTGTLTYGRPQVAAVKAYGRFKPDEVLATAAALEQNSRHILARAVVAEAGRRGLKLPRLKAVREQPGLGLSGRWRQQTILVGRAAFLQAAGVALPGRLSSSGSKTQSLIAINGKLAGRIEFKDEIRPDSRNLLRALARLGVSNSMLITGDNMASAQAVAAHLGIKEVAANCLPADKISRLEQVKRRPVAFVGDGVNDAPVLTAADVGIALGARGSTAASETADVVIMTDDVGKVAAAFKTARQTFSIARQSIIVGIALSLGLMAIYSSGRFSPLSGALLQEVVDVVVIFNALRAHYVKIA